jgi:hypothetical protein
MRSIRRILSIALALGGIFVSVTASLNNRAFTGTEADVITNNQIYRGTTRLKVALPHDMKSFPVELVPLP